MVIKASTQLVVETVVVKDKKGNPIEGLTAKDFTVTENGVPQTISFCEHQELPEAPSRRARRSIRRRKTSKSTTGWAGRTLPPRRRGAFVTRTAACWRSIST